MNLPIIAGIIGLSFIPLVIGVIVAVLGSYCAYSLFSKLTKNIDEKAELQKGNTAVGILLLSIFVSIGIVLHAGISGIAPAVRYMIKVGPTTSDGLVSLGIAVFQLVISAGLAIIAIYITFLLFSKLTGDVDEFQEISRGNIAIALEMSGIAILTALLIDAGISGIMTILY
jgi:uncharacterized membrane protein YjfL (UPF0719 family)